MDEISFHKDEAEEIAREMLRESFNFPVEDELLVNPVRDMVLSMKPFLKGDIYVMSVAKLEELVRSAFNGVTDEVISKLIDEGHLQMGLTADGEVMIEKRKIKRDPITWDKLRKDGIREMAFGFLITNRDPTEVAVEAFVQEHDLNIVEFRETLYQYSRCHVDHLITVWSNERSR